MSRTSRGRRSVRPVTSPPDASRAAALRRDHLARRRTLTLPERRDAEQALGDRVLALDEVTRASTVTAYVSLPTEPGTDALLARLHERGTTVLLPAVLDDNDLDWAAYAPGRLASGRRGIRTPTTPWLGREAVRDAAVLICPGTVADHAGHRVGRGGGSYDRAVARARVAGDPLVVLLLHDGELVDEDLAPEPHDQPVDVVVTPSETYRVP